MSTTTDNSDNDVGTATTQVVNLAVTTAPLLSGRLRDCACVHHANATDHRIDCTGADSSISVDKCNQGGVAAVQAYARHFTQTFADENGDGSTSSEPILVVPMGDFKAPLTTMSRFGFGVNVMIYHNELQWRTWTVPAYTLWPLRLDEGALYHAQDPLMEAVVSNVFTQPHELWHPYVKSIHYDEETRLALIYITKEYLSNTISQVQAAQNMVTFIYKENLARNCRLSDTQQQSTFSVFQNEVGPFSDWWRTNERATVEALARNETPPEYPESPTDEPENCFLPVIVFDDKSKSQYELFVDAFNNTQQSDVPFAIVDISGHGTTGEVPELITTINNHHSDDENSIPPTWLVSYKAGRNDYHQVQMTIERQSKQPSHRISNVQLISRDLLQLPQEIRTPEYYQDLDNIRQYAREAYETSLVKEDGVYSLAMPPPTSMVDEVQKHRNCYLGECEFGNLVADALRTLADSDVAFVPSFILDGPGWEERDIRYLDLLENLPYTAQRCGGTLTGLSLWRLLKYSLTTATFDPYGSTRTAGTLLQVSGLQVVYNQDLEPNDRLISVDIWDKETQEYRPLERTRLYTFSANTHLCFTFVNFPDLVGDLLVEEGEVPADRLTEADIKDDIQDYIYAQYSDATYSPKSTGRLVNDPSRTDTLTMTDRQDCALGRTHWDETVLDCVPCPSYENVKFSKENMVLRGQALHPDLLRDEVILTNGESTPVEIYPETISLPSNIGLELTSDDGAVVDANNTSAWVLEPKKSLKVQIAFDPSERVAGTDTSSLVFQISDFNRSVGCPAIKTKYNVVAQLSLSSDANQLDGVAAFGYVSAALIILMSLSFAIWVGQRRKNRAVLTMQPIFLIALSMGVALIGSALIPLSIDDGVASDRGNDIACMATPWLLSHGFIISISTLFSKLLRLNRVVESSELCRRVHIKAKDVILPTLTLLGVNFSLMLIWTLVDPMQWERFEVDQQPWNTYGRCSFGDGNTGQAMCAAVAVVCAVSFIMTCWQAFKARNISGEFSESRYLGIAIYSWMQLSLVGIPVLFLVEDDNVVARYSLVVGLILAVCMSMILMVFVPIILYREARRPRRASSVVILQRGARDYADATGGSGHCSSGQGGSTSLLLRTPEPSGDLFMKRQGDGLAAEKKNDRSPERSERRSGNSSSVSQAHPDVGDSSRPTNGSSAEDSDGACDSGKTDDLSDDDLTIHV